MMPDVSLWRALPGALNAFATFLLLFHFTGLFADLRRDKPGPHVNIARILAGACLIMLLGAVWS